MHWSQLISLLGLFGFVAFAWVCGGRGKPSWRILAWGLGLQLAAGLVVFQLPQGRSFLVGANRLVDALLGYSMEGAKMVFGPLGIPPGNEESMGFFFAFQALPAVIFFSSLVGLLYYWGIMGRLVSLLSRLFTKLMKISGAEGLTLSSNIFIGIESALAIRPYLRKMTSSELCLVLTAGMATIASTVLGLYVLMLQEVFPGIAGHLVSASLISAPAALVAAKLIFPETGQPETLGMTVAPYQEKRHNWIEAITTSAMDGWKLAVGIAVTLIAFLSLLALLNGGLGWLGSLFGAPQLTLQALLAYLFYPATWLMGTHAADVGKVSELLALRLLATEIPAYEQLATLLADEAFADPRSGVIAAYALCGFAHFASMGIFIGGISALEPSRTRDLGALGLRALLAATLACLMTGAIAGLLATEDQALLMFTPTENGP
ncbi:MAG: hypothetical protein LAT55_02225 [Opitutales bacterium]|nr:hypothetical protein [Opitutales bacterium]